MIYRTFRDIETSVLGMGNMRLPVQSSGHGPIDRVRAQEMIDHAMASGINYYDSAYVYHNGESEKFLGDALAGYPRDSYYLATKYLSWAGEDYKGIFKEQLKRLKTDYIDFYLVHSVSDGNYQKYIDCGCIEYYLDLKEKGHIKYLGFSSHAGVEVLKKFVSHHAWDFTQIQLNYYDWAYGRARQEYEVLINAGIPVIVMEPVRGGRLATLSPKAESILKEAHPDWSMASWALRFVKGLPGVQTILSGMSTLDQVKENVSLFTHDEALSEDEREVLFKAAEAFKNEVQVPCTNCRYCCDDCSSAIDIPRIIEIYNRYKIDGHWALNDIKKLEADNKPTPAACIECGACNDRCPQGIDVKAVMKELADAKR